MSATDLTLLDAWMQRRDAEAFHELVRRHAGMVFRTARRMLGNAAEAEDVTQECFEQLLRAEKSPQSYLAPWLHRVAVNRCLSRLRKQEVRKGNTPDPPAARDDAARIERTELHRMVDAALEHLPEELRVPLVEHFLEQRTHEEIARDLGLDRSSVTKRIQKGIEQLRAILQQRGIVLPVAALAAFFSAELAHAAPQTLFHALGKLALSGGTAAPVSAATTAGGGLTTWLWSGLAASLLVAAGGFWLAGGERPQARALSVSGALAAEPIASPAELKPVAGPNIERADAADGTEAGVGKTLQLAAMENAPAAPAAGTGQISGRVLNAATGEPVADVPVVATDPEEGNIPRKFPGKAISGVDGAFHLRDVPPGEWRVAPQWTWTYPGSSASENQVHVNNSLARHFRTARSHDECNVSLASGGTVEALELRLDFGARVGGTVFDTAGQPVAGAEVVGRASGGASNQAETDAAGKFSFPLPVGGEITLVGKKDPLVSLPYPLAMLPEGGVDGIQLTLDRPRMGSVAGTVVDSLGRPAQGIVVTLRSENNETIPPYPINVVENASKANGTFRIAEVPPGKYEVCVGNLGETGMRSGPASPRVEVIVNSAEHVQGVSVMYDTSPRDDMPTRPAHEDEIWGRVISSTGAPVANPSIWCESYPDESRDFHVIGDSRGRFLLSGLTPGTYWISALASGGLGRTEQALFEAGTSDVEIRLPGNVKIDAKGKVTDAGTGNPIAEFWVSTVDGPRREVFPGMFAREEAFRSEAGSFSVRRHQSDDATLVVAVRAKGYQPAFQNVVVADYKGEELTFALSKAKPEQQAIIRGRVVDVKGNPVPSAQLYLGGRQPNTGPFRNYIAETLPNGEFLLPDAPPGTIAVSAFHPDHGDGAAYVQEDMEIVLRQPASLTVQVLNDGEPVAGERVRVYYHADALTDFIDGARTDDNGRMEKSGLLSGAAMVSIDVAPGRSVLKEVELQPGVRTDVVLEGLPATAQVKGRVVYEDASQANARVEMTYTTAAGMEVLETATNRDGEFLFPGVPAGDARVQVMVHDGDLRLFDVDFLSVKDGEVIEHDVDFIAGADIEGTVAGYTPGQWVWVSLWTELPGEGLGVNDIMSGRGSAYVRAAKVNEDGSFTMDNVRPGTYTVHAALMPAKRVYRLIGECSATVEVREGNTPRVSLRFGTPK